MLQLQIESNKQGNKKGSRGGVFRKGGGFGPNLKKGSRQKERSS